MNHSFTGAPSFGCQVWTVDTRRYDDSMLTGSEAIIDELTERAEEIPEDLQVRADVDVTTSVRRGSPASVIGSYAAEVDADLLVLGHRGRESADEIRSTAERVVRTVDRSVLTA
ncbi:universal stress protein [Natronococcus sp. A-GB1]|nr:universal stress protein [Natronococcus sp. A-GB1]MDG5761981.1 universal stress protein [Natronococcus sp. A-GB1]